MHTDPIAFFITWTCYGTWLPGDARGSTRWRGGFLRPRPSLETWCRERMQGKPVMLSKTQQGIVEQTITDHCRHRRWHLHQHDCRSNHVHVVVTAFEYTGEVVRDQLKAWCTRRLTEHQANRGAANVDKAKVDKW